MAIGYVERWRHTGEPARFVQENPHMDGMRLGMRPISYCWTGLLVAVLLPGGGAAAQNAPFTGEVSTIDAFGNASWKWDTRLLDSYSGNVNTQAYAGLQAYKQRTENRGGTTTFSLPGDPFRVRPRALPRYPTLGPYGTSAERRIYGLYGGFGRRRAGGQSEDVETIFSRRRDLLNATSLNAPIHRARLEHGTDGIGLPWSSGGLRLAGPAIPDARAKLRSLDDRLLVGITSSHEKVKAEAWEWFGKGHEDSANYRRAARAFESAVMLDKQDIESRIGEMFSLLSVGAYRTAIVLLAEIARRDSEPFSHRLNMSDLYGDPLQARQVRMLCESFTQASEGAGTAVALQAFVLWYVGDREQAIITAEPLAVEHPDTNFADWATQMRVALPMWESTSEDR